MSQMVIDVEDQEPQYLPPPPPPQTNPIACKNNAHLVVYQSIVSIAKELLSCGIWDLLREEEPRLRSLASSQRDASKSFKASPFSKILIRMIQSIIRVQQHDIEQTFLRLIQEHLQHTDVILEEENGRVFAVCQGVFATSIPSISINHDLTSLSPSQNTTDSFSLQYCEIRSEHTPKRSSIVQNSSSEEYRKVVATHGIGRGIEVLHEHPYAFALNSHENCLESIDNTSALLRQHVHLAFALFQQRHRNLLKVNHFLRQFTSGLSVKEETEGKGKEDDDLLYEYSFSSQCLMAMICTLFCHFQEEFHLPTTSTTTTTTSTRSVGSDAAHGIPATNNSADTAADHYGILGPMEDKITRASLLLEIMARLPLNTHAISTVVSSSASTSNTSIVEKTCLGLAVFLQASAINHSCQANAIVKYSLPASLSVSKLSLEMQAMSFLKELTIHILANQSIARGEEICICYGPRASKHNLATRQKLLKQQYLFECTCQACQEDIQHVQTQAAIDLQQRQVQDKQSKQAILHQYVNVSVEEIKLLCRALGDVKQSLEMINVTFSELLNITRKSTTTTLLQGFENSKLLPLHQQLLSIQKGYFSKEWKYFQDNKQCQEGEKKTSNQLIRDTEWLSLWREYCGYYCMYLDIYAHLLAQCSDFAKAAIFVEESIELMLFTDVYPDEDIVIAREQVKLASLWMNAGNTQQCYAEVSKALPVLQLLCDRSSQGDPDLMQATQLYLLTSRLLKFPLHLNK